MKHEFAPTEGTAGCTFLMPDGAWCALPESNSLHRTDGPDVTMVMQVPAEEGLGWLGERARELPVMDKPHEDGGDGGVADKWAYTGPMPGAAVTERLIVETPGKAAAHALLNEGEVSVGPWPVRQWLTAGSDPRVDVALEALVALGESFEMYVWWGEDYSVRLTRIVWGYFLGGSQDEMAERLRSWV